VVCVVVALGVGVRVVVGGTKVAFVVDDALLEDVSVLVAKDGVPGDESSEHAETSRAD